MSGVLLAVAVGAVVLVLAVVAVGQVMAGRARAQAGADAAALAAAPVTFRPFGADGSARREAALFARANGVVLVVCRCPPDSSWEPRTVVVEVEHSFRVVLFGSMTARASAWAEFVPTRLLEDPVVPERAG